MVSLKIVIILCAYLGLSLSVPLKTVYARNSKARRLGRQTELNASPPYIYSSPSPSIVSEVQEGLPSNGYLPPLPSAVNASESTSTPANNDEELPSSTPVEQSVTTLNPFVSEVSNNASLQSTGKNETELTESNVTVEMTMINGNSSSVQQAEVSNASMVMLMQPTNAYLPPDTEKPDQLNVEQSSEVTTITSLNTSPQNSSSESSTVFTEEPTEPNTNVIEQTTESDSKPATSTSEPNTDNKLPISATEEPKELNTSTASTTHTTVSNASVIQQSSGEIDHKPEINTLEQTTENIQIPSTEKPKELVESMALVNTNATNTNDITTLTPDKINATPGMSVLPVQPANSEEEMKLEVPASTTSPNTSNNQLMGSTETPKELFESMTSATVSNSSEVPTSTAQPSDVMEVMSSSTRPTNAYLPPIPEKPNKLEKPQSSEAESPKKPESSTASNINSGFTEHLTEQAESMTTTGATVPNVEATMVVEMKPTNGYLPPEPNMSVEMSTIENGNISATPASNTEGNLAVTPTSANVHLSPSSMLMEEILPMDNEKTETIASLTTTMTLSPSNTIMLMENVPSREIANPNYMYSEPSLLMVEEVPTQDSKSESTATVVSGNGHVFSEDGYHYRVGTGFEYPVYYQNYL